MEKRKLDMEKNVLGNGKKGREDWNEKTYKNGNQENGKMSWEEMRKREKRNRNEKAYKNGNYENGKTRWEEMRKWNKTGRKR